MINIVEFLVNTSSKPKDVNSFKIDLDNLSTLDVINALTDKGYKVISNATNFGRYSDNYVVLLKKGSILCMYVEYHDYMRINKDELSYAIAFSSKNAFNGEAVSANINKPININGYEWIKDACEALSAKPKIWCGIGRLWSKKNSWSPDKYSTVFAMYKKDTINKLVDQIKKSVI